MNRRGFLLGAAGAAVAAASGAYAVTQPLVVGLMEGLRIAAPQTVSEWADSNVFLDTTQAAEPGPFRTDRTPYAREMMDTIIDPQYEMVVFHTSAQVAKTTAMLNGLGHYIEHDPCPIMFVVPSKELAETFSKAKLAPFINNTPALADRCGRTDSRATTGTLYRKEFPGGFLNLVGAQSAASLAMQSIRVVMADEIDRFPQNVGGEGDPLLLAFKRSQTFSNRKLVVSSTPTLKGVSNIDAYFERSDKRYRYVKLPCCGFMQPLVWENVKWKKGQPETAEYMCSHCGGLNSDNDIKRACTGPDAAWVRTAPQVKNIAGFHIWQIYSPFATMEKIVAEYEAHQDTEERKQNFVNTVLGESYDSAQALKTTPEEVFEARRSFPEWMIPAGAALMTAGVDVQVDRIEILFVAHGPNNRHWFCKKQVVYGEPSADATWDRVEMALQRRWAYETHPSITRSLSGVAIDSGYLTQRVYDFANKAHNAGRPWFAVKGMAGDGKIAWLVSETKLKSGARLHNVGIDTLKGEIHARLTPTKDGPAQITIRKDDCFDLQTIEQLFAEKVRIIVNSRGFKGHEWHKMPGKANELFDMAVYAEAVHRSLTPDHEAILAGLREERGMNAADLARMFGHGS